MNIGRQWEDRLRIWAEELPKHYYRPAATLPVEYFTTMEQLSYEVALGGSFAALSPGDKWGKKWEYAWVRTCVTIPESLAGQRVVFTLGVGPEMLVWVNGQEAGAIDKHHKYITLSRCAVAGERYEILAECYAGHGIRNEGAGIVAWGAETVPEPPEQQVTVGLSTYGLWNEPLFQVAMDYLTLYSLVKKLPAKSLRAMKIIDGLKKFTYIADFELPEPAMTASVVKAGGILKPLLECRNGSTAPDYTVFGQSHLDLAWLWPVEETRRKTARTYSNQLALMEEYPDYGFLLCEPPILEWLKQLYPNVYDRVKDGVEAGKFYPEGALWVESDTNIPSGESLIRQFVRGKRWFRRELGVDSRMAWMPDTFGFSAALPQIMKKCQIPYFATQKLIRQDPECQSFPYNHFWWEGLDGSRVLSHTFKKNNAVFQAGDLITRWEEDRVQQENIDGLMFPFGYGDGGGGPTREMLEMARRCADLEGAPRCHMESPTAYFDRHPQAEEVFRGELYLAWHRGTLTSQAKTKSGIRWAEIALRNLEFVLSRQLLAGQQLPENWRQRLEGLWDRLLFNQFHDIAPGTSIARVHQRAEKELADVERECAAWQRQLLDDPEGKLVVYNPLSWQINFCGTKIPAQSCVPVRKIKKAPGYTLGQCPEGWLLENPYLRCIINESGELVSVRKPGEDQEYLAGKGNHFLLFKDVNTCYDAWELGSMYEKMPVALEDRAEITMLNSENQPVLQIKKRIGGSELEQRIFLKPDEPVVVFETKVQWQEKHKLLKVAFPVNAYCSDAFHETQFGYVRRPVHRSYQTDKDRYEVCNHRYTALTDGAHGAAVLNNGKYGVNVVENEIRLTLLKSAMMPDQNADQGEQHFVYAFYPFDGAFADSDVVQQAALLNAAPILGAFRDDLGPIFLLDRKNIIVETIKPADTADNALLVRAYEAMGMKTVAHFQAALQIQKIEETDMLEENPVAVEGKVEFGPFEIKTFLLHL